ncbi:hypothetical protein SD70_18445, partial [Gordoniibacillus kamchatkensis]
MEDLRRQREQAAKNPQPPKREPSAPQQGGVTGATYGSGAGAGGTKPGAGTGGASAPGAGA